MTKGLTFMKKLKTVWLWAAVLPQLAWAQHDHAAHQHGSSSTNGMMPGVLGGYSMSREASGTSWQPETTPMEGVHLMRGEWMLMFHGFANGVYTHHDGPRGDDGFYGPNMLMGMASRKVGPGTFGARAMLSLEPATIGKSGYPELLQNGETGDGVSHLIDRQHPHDLFMELALSYSLTIREDSSAFAYFGLPGEPALGPPTFMHRFSGVDNPEAPITHHWLDSTHIGFGVATVGYIWRQFKADASIFTGREPDERRWNIERLRMDSYSARLSWNPTKDWAAQVSYGNIHSPEQLHPEIDTQRITASLMYAREWEQAHWQTTLAWGRNVNDPGRTLDGLLLESALRCRDTHTFFGRAESVEKDELFPEGHPNEGHRYLVHKVSLGYIYDFPKWHFLRAGVGGMGSAHFLPHALEADYGDTPLSFSIFARVKF
jgi:hypothetical protein